MRKINKAGLNLVKTFEGLSLKPYKCPADKVTIGYGTTYYEDNTKVTMQDPPISEDRALQLLEVHINAFCSKVEKLIQVPVTDNQFAALVSFAYNLGAGALGGSTLIKKLNAKDYSGAAEEFEKWNKAGGSVLAGLTRRRQAEKALFLQNPASQSSSALPDGPSDSDIDVKLEDIEKEIQ